VKALKNNLALRLTFARPGDVVAMADGHHQFSAQRRHRMSSWDKKSVEDSTQS
jgi:hypothetical protein